MYTLYEYPDIVTEFKVNRLRYAGHVIREFNNYPSKQVLQSTPEGSIGTAKKIKGLYDDAKNLDLNGEVLTRA